MGSRSRSTTVNPDEPRVRIGVKLGHEISRQLSSNSSNVVGFRTVAEIMACDVGFSSAEMAATRGATRVGS